MPIPNAMQTNVVNVAGRSPNEWMRHGQNVYVGRYIFLQSGTNEGQCWPGSPFCNPNRISREAKRSEHLQNLYTYAVTLRERLKFSKMTREAFCLLPGKTLGCWCVDWDGSGHVPLCHAAWLARIVDLIFEPTSQGVKISRDGAIEQWDRTELDESYWCGIPRKRI